MADLAYIAKTKVAYDIVAESYSTLVPSISPHPVDRSLVVAFADLLLAAGRCVVAEVGCGPGHVTKYLSDLGLDARGIDLSPGMLDVARRNYPDLRFDTGSLEALPLVDASLDGLVAWYSIIHIPPERLSNVFAELARVLRPDALVLLAFQEGSGPRHLAHAYGHDIDLDAYFVPLDGVRAALKSAGFRVVAELVRAQLPEEKSPQGFVLAAVVPPARQPWSVSELRVL